MYLTGQLDKYRDECQHKGIRQARLLPIKRTPVGEYTSREIIKDVTHELVIGTGISSRDDFSDRWPDTVCTLYKQRGRYTSK